MRGATSPAEYEITLRQLTDEDIAAGVDPEDPMASIQATGSEITMSGADFYERVSPVETAPERRIRTRGPDVEERGLWPKPPSTKEEKEEFRQRMIDMGGLDPSPVFRPKSIGLPSLPFGEEFLETKVLEETPDVLGPEEFTRVPSDESRLLRDMPVVDPERTDVEEVLGPEEFTEIPGIEEETTPTIRTKEPSVVERPKTPSEMIGMPPEFEEQTIPGKYWETKPGPEVGPDVGDPGIGEGGTFVTRWPGMKQQPGGVAQPQPMPASPRVTTTPQKQQWDPSISEIMGPEETKKKMSRSSQTFVSRIPIFKMTI
jgi:hypothetical protein